MKKSFCLISSLVVLLVSLLAVFGCGGGGGGGNGSFVSQIVGVPTDIPPVPASQTYVVPGPSLSLSDVDGSKPYGVLRSYEGPGYRRNNIYINRINVVDSNIRYATSTFQVDGTISGQIDIAWYYSRPEQISEVELYLAGDIGTSLMELKYEGSLESEVLKKYSISGQLYTDKLQRVSCNLLVDGVWKVVLSIKGPSGKKINLSISCNERDTFASSPEEQNGRQALDIFKEIYANVNYIEGTRNLGPSNKYSVANSINLTLQRLMCRPTKESIDIALSYILEVGQKSAAYHILDRNTHVIIFNGTSAANENEPREIYSYCQSLGITDIDFVDGPRDLEAKAKFLDAIVKSSGKTAILIHSDGDPYKFQVKVLRNEDERTVENVAKFYLSYGDFANALLERAKRCGGRLDDVMICYEACEPADYIVNMLTSLSRDTQFCGGNIIKSLPLLVASANRGQPSWPIGFYPALSFLKNPPILTVADMMEQEEVTFYPNDHAFFIPDDVEKFNEMKQKLITLGQGSGLPNNLPIVDLNIKRGAVLPYIQFVGKKK